MPLRIQRSDPVQPGFCLQCGKLAKPPSTVCVPFLHTKKMSATLRAGGWGFQMDVQGLTGHESRKKISPNGLKKVPSERRWMGSVDTGRRCFVMTSSCRKEEGGVEGSGGGARNYLRGLAGTLTGTGATGQTRSSDVFILDLTGRKPQMHWIFNLARCRRPLLVYSIRVGLSASSRGHRAARAAFPENRADDVCVPSG